MNIVIFCGRLVTEPESRGTTQKGDSHVTFRLAVSRGKSESDFFNIDAWGRTADFILQWFHKGDPIALSCEARNHNYTDRNGQKHYGYQFCARDAWFVPQKKADTPPAATGAAQPGGAGEGLSVGELSEFEEVLSDGDVPF